MANILNILVKVYCSFIHSLVLYWEDIGDSDISTYSNESIITDSFIIIIHTPFISVEQPWHDAITLLDTGGRACSRISSCHCLSTSLKPPPSLLGGGAADTILTGGRTDILLNNDDNVVTLLDTYLPYLTIISTGLSIRRSTVHDNNDDSVMMKHFDTEF